ncbi:MAG: hypothetical protein GF417_02730 [Candidatus Latescibacteria bacterium]|nr:hypothetical protein [bacterium]MBD3423345.1 hypothetical protein [Candidatus Latescibacterota bacterium]
MDDSLPRVYLSGEELREGKELIMKHTGLDPDRNDIAAIHPGGTWQAKRWPPYCFGKLIERIEEDAGMKSVILTGPGEENIVDELLSSCGRRPGVIPYLPVRKAGAVMKVSDCVIANDGGVMHLSVALGKPTVGILGPTEPEIWFPYGDMGPFRVATLNLECAPCHRHYCEEPVCLTGLSVDMVFEKLMEALEAES